MVRLAAYFSGVESGPLMKKNVFAADQELIHALVQRSSPITCNQNSVLFTQDQIASGLFILQSGEAALMMESRPGKAVMCLHAASGSLPGMPAICANAPYTLTATVREGSDVRFVTRDDFEKAIQAEPPLAFKALQIVASEVIAARRAISEM
jgi:CRP-like cAMP-binding protein